MTALLCCTWPEREQRPRLEQQCNAGEARSALEDRFPSARAGAGRALKIVQQRSRPEPLRRSGDCMSVIFGQRPLAVGMDAATSAIRRSQDRLATAAAEIARQGAAQNNSANPPAKATSSASLPAQAPSASLPAQTPPNPGPPGGAHPADLAQAMMDEQLATHELAANVKTVQAFDQMLEELSRLGRSTNTPSSGG